MTTKLAINGFGRIGRMIMRALVETGRKDLEIVAINDLGPSERLAQLLKYDSVHGPLKAEVTATTDSLEINGTKIATFAERDPANLPWKKLGVDIVLECTGHFLTQELCQKHISAGAKKVLMSAPSKDKSKTIVYGVNDELINASDDIISNASCTTNALAPLLSVLHSNFGVKSGMMTTIHAYTGNQPTHDSLHKDPYRGRAAALSMIPTTTGAAKAIGLVLPELDGKLDGMAIRVPVPNVSMVDLSVIVEKATSVEEVCASFKAASQKMHGVLGYIDDPLVSTDLNHDPRSSCFVPDQSYVNQEHLVRIMSWYDNEWGFSNRMLDTAALMSRYL